MDRNHRSACRNRWSASSEYARPESTSSTTCAFCLGVYRRRAISTSFRSARFHHGQHRVRRSNVTNGGVFRTWKSYPTARGSAPNLTALRNKPRHHGRPTRHRKARHLPPAVTSSPAACDTFPAVAGIPCAFKACPASYAQIRAGPCIDWTCAPRITYRSSRSVQKAAPGRCPSPPR